MNIGFLYGVRTYPPGVSGSVHGYQLARNLAAKRQWAFLRVKVVGMAFVSMALGGALCSGEKNTNFCAIKLWAG